MQYDGRRCSTWCGDLIDVHENPGGKLHPDCDDETERIAAEMLEASDD